jgi:drug/metabolite transporter (DMT)-like permease
LVQTVFLTLIAALLRIFSNPLGNVFQKQLTSKGHPPFLVNFTSYILLSIVCVFFSFSVPWSSLPFTFWTFSIYGGIAGALGNGFLVKALENGDLSVLGPINAYKSVVGIMLAIVLLGEYPTIWGLIGMALIIYGSYFVLDTTEDKFSLRLFKRKEIQYRLLAMVLTAIEAVFDKKVILVSSPAIAFISWCWFGALFSLILILITKQKIINYFSHIRVNDLYKYLYLITCIGIMQFSTNYVFQHMPVGYALALFQLSVIVSVLLGHRLFKETNIRKKLIGSVIMIAGSVMIILL